MHITLGMVLNASFSVPKNWASNPVWGRGRGTKQGGNFTGDFIRPDIIGVANL
jgi:hypothetical protein